MRSAKNHWEAHLPGHSREHVDEIEEFEDIDIGANRSWDFLGGANSHKGKPESVAIVCP
jgi:hypothetical protein